MHAWFRRSAALPLRLLAATVLVLAAGSGRTGILEDDEARKAILDLRTRVLANDEAAKSRHNELTASTAQMVEQLQQLRRSLVELNTLIESQRAELARMRGIEEQLQRDVAELQRRQRDGVSGVEERLRKLEPQQVSVDGKDFLVESDERRAFEDAVTLLRTGDFDKSAAALAGFVRRYPASGYLDSARFWLGNAYYGKRDYKEAIATFRALVNNAPDHPRAAEALLAIANCQVEMKDVKGARRTLDDLLKAYPKSEAAAAGRERLSTLKG